MEQYQWGSDGSMQPMAFKSHNATVLADPRSIPAGQPFSHETRPDRAEPLRAELGHDSSFDTNTLPSTHSDIRHGSQVILVNASKKLHSVGKKKRYEQPQLISWLRRLILWL